MANEPHCYSGKPGIPSCWQAAELLYFVAFYGELMAASGKQVFPEGVFVFASVLRLVTLCVLVGFVVRDILRPEHDAVRSTYDGGDPDGGAFDGAPDGTMVEWMRRKLQLPPRSAAQSSSL